jgi:hypothetical protein
VPRTHLRDLFESRPYDPENAIEKPEVFYALDHAGSSLSTYAKPRRVRIPMVRFLGEPHSVEETLQERRPSRGRLRIADPVRCSGVRELILDI